MNRQHYLELIDNLHLAVQQQFGSVAAYCVKHHVNRPNLVAIFRKRQDISIGLFLKIMCDIERLSIQRPEQNFNMSLLQYLQINHTTVMLAIMNLYTNAPFKPT